MEFKIINEIFLVYEMKHTVFIVSSLETLPERLQRFRKDISDFFFEYDFFFENRISLDVTLIWPIKIGDFTITDNSSDLATTIIRNYDDGSMRFIIRFDYSGTIANDISKLKRECKQLFNLVCEEEKK